MKSLVLGILSIVSISLSAAERAEALVRPDGYVHQQQCGKNLAHQLPGKAQLSEVCLGSVQGGLPGTGRNANVILVKMTNGTSTYTNVFEIRTETRLPSNPFESTLKITISQIGYVDAQGLLHEVLFHRGVFGELVYTLDDSNTVLNMSGEIDGHQVQTDIFERIFEIQ